MLNGIDTRMLCVDVPCFARVHNHHDIMIFDYFYMQVLYGKVGFESVRHDNMSMYLHWELQGSLHIHDVIGI